SFWVAGPGLARIIPGRHTLDRTASTLDLVSMVTYLLDVPEPGGLDGANPLANLQGKLTGPRRAVPGDPDSSILH
ncbi:MAG: hypothetical protein JRJ38_13630, partial [Deltaproteobacteria bacterium]|nr:hypothetical protein [Deltaproteobacteria bacterium]